MSFLTIYAPNIVTHFQAIVSLFLMDPHFSNVQLKLIFISAHIVQWVSNWLSNSCHFELKGIHLATFVIKSSFNPSCPSWKIYLLAWILRIELIYASIDMVSIGILDHFTHRWCLLSLIHNRKANKINRKVNEVLCKIDHYEPITVHN